MDEAIATSSQVNGDAPPADAPGRVIAEALLANERSHAVVATVRTKAADAGKR